MSIGIRGFELKVPAVWQALGCYRRFGGHKKVDEGKTNERGRTDGRVYAELVTREDSDNF